MYVKILKYIIKFWKVYSTCVIRKERLSGNVSK